jgi:peptidoglycan/xylan/chitin deacetylase (PgdA/CDA1 family)
MRIIGAFLACLLAGSALAQSASKEAGPAAAPAAQPVSQPAEPSAPTPIVKAALTPAAQPAAKPIEPAATPPQPAEAPAAAVKPDQQAVAAPTAEPAAMPADEVATPAAISPEQEPAAAPVTKPVQQAVATPAEMLEQALPTPDYPIEPVMPAVKPAEPAPPAAEPVKTAEACPGHPDALGTSRVLTITPAEFQLLGVIDYKQTLPLKDHEVVLTFDDGPIPPYTTSVLDTLAANCVKATYFLVGEMAQERPYLVRRIYNEGHSIGTHSQHHPFAFQRLSMQRVEREVDGGIASVTTALGDAKALSPFFRIPGFGRTNAIDHYLENKGLITWSADIDTDDWWRGTTPSALIQRAMRRLNAKGRGIILLHDIHPSTALALPTLLKALKAGGYHVVHVVAAGEQPKSLPEVVATPLEKEGWPRVLHAKAEKGGAAMSALRHRVKRVLAGRSKHHHHYRRTHTARAESEPKAQAYPAAATW